MELRQLNCFVWIADTGRFSDASRAMCITQSAVSQQIKALEEELGTQLFVRNTHSVSLTEAGEHLLPVARQVVQGVTSCYECLAELKGLLRGELHLGLTFTLEPYVRPAMLAFMKAHPQVQMCAHYKTLPELLRKLRDNEIDVMLSMMPTSPHDFVESEPLLKTHVGVVMRATHPLAQMKKLSFATLKTHGFILPERGLRDRNAIESFIHAKTGDLDIRALVNDPNAILNILEESNYVSILSENLAAARPDLCWRPVEEIATPVTIYAHYNREVTRKRSLDVFINMFRQTSAYLVTASSGSA